jgi:hypothetical protein
MACLLENASLVREFAESKDTRRRAAEYFIFKDVVQVEHENGKKSVVIQCAASIESNLVCKKDGLHNISV